MRPYIITLITILSLSVSLGWVYSFWTLVVGSNQVISGSGNISGEVNLLESIPEWAGKRIPIMKNIHKKLEILPFFEDTSIYRFVSRDTPLNDKTYEPDDLVSISGASINTAGRSGLKMRLIARDALWSLADAFEIKFGTPLTVISTYRSAAYQKRMWDLGKCSDSLCAPPGSSEHQTGLAMDLFDATTNQEYMENWNYRRYIAWLQKNAHLYGWTQSYQKGENIDGYEVEPWHWRYIWRDLATRLKNLGWTYTEYVRFQEVLARNY